MMPLLMTFGQGIFGKSPSDGDGSVPDTSEVEMTPLRKFFMTQWDDPADPTMVSQFNMDVSCLDFFAKKYPPETLTTLMLQAVSSTLMQDPSFRNFLSYKKLRQTREAKVAIVVKLPGCQDHLGAIIYKNCHEMTVSELTRKIRNTIQKMAYCYKKCQQIEKQHPHFKRNLDDMLYEYAHGEYPYPVPGSAFVSLSNIGHCGYSQAVSPLRKNESLKVTLLQVERKPVWDKVTQSFVAKDMMPISIRADHRVFDGNLPIPHYLDTAFQSMFQNMLGQKPSLLREEPLTENFLQTIDRMLAENLEIGYRLLIMLQNIWSDDTDVERIFYEISKKVVIQKSMAYF